MKSISLLFALGLACASAIAQDSVVVGRLVENAPMSYVPNECPENVICLRSWWKSVIRIEKTIQGRKLTDEVGAAVLQHADLSPAFKAGVRLFVLRPITDSQQGRKLRVSYYLQEMIRPRQMYCLGQPPAEYGLEIKNTYQAGEGDSASYCFELPPG